MSELKNKQTTFPPVDEIDTTVHKDSKSKYGHTLIIYLCLD